MSNPSKQKGTAFETAVVNYLDAAGIPVRRNPPAGSKDVGDISTTDGDWIIECKNTKRIDLAGACDELTDEVFNANVKRKSVFAVRGVAIVKRTRKNISEAYCVMPLREFVEVLRRVEGYA